MAKRIPGVSPEWSEYLTCILLHMTLPLLPLLFEAIALKGPPTQGTVAITTAIYAISIGLSSENKAMFGLCVFIGFVFSALYGVIAAAGSEASSILSWAAWISMIFVFVIHACERYNKHVVDCRPFLHFSNGGRSDGI